MIKHIQCDIFKSGADVICHQVNCQGAMNSGIAKQVRTKYPWVYGEYKDFCQYYSPEDLLGLNLITWIDETHRIANLFGQENFGYDGKCYTNYEELRNALEDLRFICDSETIAIPYLMGCHRGGGDWNVVYKMIEEVFADYDGDVLICEYNGG